MAQTGDRMRMTPKVILILKLATCRAKQHETLAQKVAEINNTFRTPYFVVYLLFLQQWTITMRQILVSRSVRSSKEKYALRALIEKVVANLLVRIEEQNFHRMSLRRIRKLYLYGPWRHIKKQVLKYLAQGLQRIKATL